jgi:hypothetical protein
MCDVQLNKSDACSTKFNQSWRVVWKFWDVYFFIYVNYFDGVKMSY